MKRSLAATTKFCSLLVATCTLAGCQPEKENNKTARKEVPVVVRKDLKVESNVDRVQENERVQEEMGVQIHSTIQSPAVKEQLDAVAQATWEIAADFYAVKSPDKPLHATVYRTTADYEAAEQELTKGRFKRNLAFAHFETKSAHVALQPSLTDEGLADVGLPALTAQLAAHEIAHTVRYHAMPLSFRSHPMWIVDGAASWIDRKVVQQLGFCNAANEDSKTGASIVMAQRLLKADKLPTASALLKNAVLNLKFYENYAVRWIFFDYLMTHHETAMRRWMPKLKNLPGGTGFTALAYQALLSELEMDLESLDSEFKKHVLSFEPKWVDEIRSLETAGDAWHQIAFPESNATSWRQGMLPDSFHVKVQGTLLRGNGKQLNFRFGQPSDFVQLSLTAGYGLNVFRFQNQKWDSIERQEIGGLNVGKPISIEISYSAADRVLQMSLDQKETYNSEIDIPKSPLLGLGAQKGSVVEWRGLSIR